MIRAVAFKASMLLHSDSSTLQSIGAVAVRVEADGARPKEAAWLGRRTNATNPKAGGAARRPFAPRKTRLQHLQPKLCFSSMISKASDMFSS